MSETSMHAGSGPECARGSNVFSVPPGEPFLEVVAEAVLDGRLGGAARPGQPAGSDPLALTGVTILLPTRRAVRAMQTAFLRASPANALLLPFIRPVDDSNEDAALIHALANCRFGGDLSLPPAVGELERRLILTTLVQRWSEALRKDIPPDGDMPDDTDRPLASAGARTPAQAVHLAREMARLIDMVETENVSLTGLSRLVPDALSEHWQQTVDFLKIIMEWWPAQLSEMGQLSPADRRNRLILAEANRLRNSPPKAPVIVAGVTGSIPATADLIRAVLESGNGYVVLPGLDREMADDVWMRLGADNPEHPQRSLSRLLAALKVDRNAVVPLLRARSAKSPPRDLAVRARLVSAAMQPAQTTHEWRHLPQSFEAYDAAGGFAGVAYLVAPTAQDEAEAIGLIMRRAAEDPERTAALVTPDRLLARRVVARLESWGIRVDDSAGRPFAKTVPGAFLDLVIAACAENFAPAALMALLKHPLTRLGRPVRDIRKAARVLEIAAFRAPYIGTGLVGIEAAIELQHGEVEERRRRDRATLRLGVDDWAAAGDLITDLENAYAPLEALRAAAGVHGMQTLAEAHLRVAEALAALPPEDCPADEEGEPARELWRDEAGHSAASLFAGLIAPDMVAPSMSLDAYPDFYRALIAGESVRSTVPVHPNLAIWGPYEARLQRPDIVILGSLNEGTWPEAADPGPWINRPMRRELGLPLPEERIGDAAHDFTQLLGADRVYLTRAEKVDGNPTVPSRWLLRLQTVLGAVGAGNALDPDEPWLAWARARDAAPEVAPARQPEPRPPLRLRPRKLSVSSIETWIANPYALYASRILKLDPMPPLGGDPDASLRGSIVHEALGRFAVRHPVSLPDDIESELFEIAQGIFLAYRTNPRIAAFWLERFHRFARWFAEQEPALREGATRTLAEVSGDHVLDAPAGPFRLTARADRIDVTGQGLVITDYKTGASLDSLASKAKSGEAPQLLLEALIAAADGFGALPTRTVSGLQFISAAGGEPAGLVVPVKCDGDIAEASRQMGQRLAALVALFDDPSTPYKAVRRARFRYDFDAYAQLARVAEWASADGGGES